MTEVTDDLFRRWQRTDGRFPFGADYNPEQLDESVWDEDISLMKSASVSMVTLGIFSWAWIEPRPGEFDFGWFDRVMERLGDAGIGVCLATMTASPPPWLAQRYPGTLPRQADGTILWPGARQHYCPSSAIYRQYARRLAESLAERYGDHPALAMWHVGNEYGCHVTKCYCDVSAEDFRTWLRKRYGGVAALNEAWSTAFWSQRYEDFSEVLPPRSAPTFPNPAQQLDFARFSSDALLECFLMEREALRARTPEVPITTNFAGGWKRLNTAGWAEHQDVISYDAYPDPHDELAPVRVAFDYDLMRSVKGGRPWLLLEQAPGAVNWRERNAPKKPGQMRLWSYQAVAHGADSVLYFQWRQSRGGAERFHSAMVPHGGVETRTFRESAEMGAELSRLPDLLGSSVEAESAIVFDWNSGQALETDSHPAGDLTQDEANISHYLPLWRAGISVDVVSPTVDLSRYRLLVVPNLYLVDTEVAEELSEWVRAGGHLVMSFFSGIVDSCDRVHLGGYPGPFRDMLGLRITEFWPPPAGESVPITFTDGARASGALWSEWIELAGAEPIARFSGGDLDGLPAITRHQYGDGVAWYLGTRPEPASMARILREAAEGAGVRPVLPDLPDGVEATVRRMDSGGRRLFVLNHNATAVTVTLPAGGVDLLTGEPLAAETTLPPRGVVIAALNPHTGQSIS